MAPSKICSQGMPPQPFKQTKEQQCQYNRCMLQSEVERGLADKAKLRNEKLSKMGCSSVSESVPDDHMSNEWRRQSRAEHGGMMGTNRRTTKGRKPKRRSR